MKNNATSIIYLLLLTVIVSLITYYRILVQIDMGPVSDSVVFLSNALVFAGQSTGYSNLLFPPLFSFIVSWFFILGYVSATAIFVLDGVLFILGVIGLFFFLKIRFNNLQSFLGGLLYATFPIVLTILGLGLSDLASVSFSIWAIYFLVLAVKNDSKFFYLAFPLAMLAFLTRYNSALLIFPIFLYIMINRVKINYNKFFIGIVASILTIIPVFILFYETFGNILSPFISFGSTSTIVSVTTNNPYYNPNVFFFLEKFPALIGTQGIVIILILVFSIILLLFYRLIVKTYDKESIFHDFTFRNHAKNMKLILFTSFLIIFLVSFGNTSYFLSELLFLVLSYIFYELSKNKFKDMDIHIMVFSWFMAFFIFHSIFVIKDVRYFVAMAPPVAYFMILGLSEISKRMRFNIKNFNLTFSVITITITSIILLSTASQIPLILQTNQDNVLFNEQLESASQWFENYDPNYKDKNIYSDLGPNFSWYLKTNVKPMPIFHGNQTFLNGIIDFTFSQEDSNKFNNYLKSNNADYYFSVRQGLNLLDYTPIKQFGNLILYKKKT
jgi:hypothetical protein